MCQARFAVLTLVFGVALQAQVTGRLIGTVVDPTGASVPNAKVGLYLPGGNSPLLSGSTNSDGIFDFIAVRPDMYVLKIEAAGFNRMEQADVKVDPARQLMLAPIALTLAAANQAVEVSANVTMVDTATAEVATTVSQSQITNLPVLSRQIVNLFNTQAGVTQNNRTVTVINGMRPSYSNVLYDGINVQDTVRTNDLDLLNNRFTIAQVAEFTVSTTNASPTIGGGASTIVMVSPSGTNQLHGSGYWFNRNNFLAANDWFNNTNGVVRPNLNLNQVGGTIGGAVIKDKLFFYGTYEAYRLKRQSPTNRTIPTPTARQGILQYLVNGSVQQFDVFKATGLPRSTLVAGLLSQVPTVGNNTAIGDNLNTTGFSFNRRSNITRDNVTGKVDYNHSSKHVFTGTYAWNRDVPDRNDGNGTTTGGYYTVTPPTLNQNHINLLSGAWRWTPTSSLTNELRAGFDWAYIPFVNNQKNPAYFLSGLFFASPYQSAELGEGRDNHQYNIQDNANWVHGKHTVSFGFQASLLSSYAWNFNAPASFLPVYTIGLGTSGFGFNVGDIPGANSTFTTTANNILASLAGLVSSGQQAFNVSSRTSGYVAGAPSVTNQRWNQYALYAQDNIKLRRNLTLTLGLRWDYFAPVDETDGLASTPRLINNNPVATLLGNATLDFTGTSVGASFYKKDLNNFAPNVALAWDPFGNGKTSIRSGFSIAYLNDNYLNSVYNSAIAVNNGLSTTRSVASLNARADAPPTISAPPFQFPTTTLAQFQLSPSAPPVEGLINNNLATPYVEQWNLAIQHEVKGFVFEGRYVGNHAVKMFRGIDLNQINIQQSGFLQDFIRARNNGFAAVAAGGTFNPAYNANIKGSQPLTFLTQLPGTAANTALTNATLLANLRSGEVGTYAQNMMSLYPYPALGFSFFPNPYLLYAEEMTNLSTANYNGLQLEVRKRTRSGFQFQANYVFSKALTDSNALRALDPQIDNASPTVERARADYDLTHVFKANFVLPLPIGSGHRLSSRNRILKQAIDGWSVSGFGVLQTGSPVSIFSARGTLNRGARSGNNSVDTSANLSALHQATGLFMTGNGPYWLDPSHIGPDTRGVAADGSAPFPGQIFFNPQPGTQGSLQKRPLDGPQFRNLDFAVVKTFHTTERQTLDFHFDFFNVFNHPNFFLNDQTVNNTGFGRITAQNYANDGVGPRVIQLGLYYRF
jgi:hypothetical protein